MPIASAHETFWSKHIVIHMYFYGISGQVSWEAAMIQLPQSHILKWWQQYCVSAWLPAGWLVYHHHAVRAEASGAKSLRGKVKASTPCKRSCCAPPRKSRTVSGLQKSASRRSHRSYYGHPSLTRRHFVPYSRIRPPDVRDQLSERLTRSCRLSRGRGYGPSPHSLSG